MSSLMWKIADGADYAKFIIKQDIRFQNAMREELCRMAEDRGLRVIRSEKQPEPIKEVVPVQSVTIPAETVIFGNEDIHIPTWKVIRDEVCQKHKIRPVDLISARRDRPAVLARHEAAYRMRNETTMSLPMIAKRLGGRDHTTILHAVRKHGERLKESEKTMD